MAKTGAEGAYIQKLKATRFPEGSLKIWVKAGRVAVLTAAVGENCVVGAYSTLREAEDEQKRIEAEIGTKRTVIFMLTADAKLIPVD